MSFRYLPDNTKKEEVPHMVDVWPGDTFSVFVLNEKPTWAGDGRMMRYKADRMGRLVEVR